MPLCAGDTEIDRVRESILGVVEVESVSPEAPIAEVDQRDIRSRIPRCYVAPEQARLDPAGGVETGVSVCKVSCLRVCGVHTAPCYAMRPMQ